MKKTWKYKIRPITVRDGEGHIPLQNGMVAIVDIDDIPLVEGWNWCAESQDGSLTAVRRAGNTNRIRALHRTILGLRDPKQFADHRNGNVLDNRRQNLRLANYSQNAQNRRAVGASGFKGVYLRECGTYRCGIRVQGTAIYLGTFQEAVEAAKAYDAAAIKHFGAYARLNFPEAK